MQERWQECAELLSTKLSEQAFRTWIKPLVFLGFDPAGRVVRLGAPTQIKVDVVRKQYLRLISASLQEQFDTDVSVQFEVLNRPPRADGAPDGAFDAASAALGHGDAGSAHVLADTAGGMGAGQAPARRAVATPPTAATPAPCFRRWDRARRTSAPS